MADAQRGLVDLSEGERQELEAWLVAFDQQWDDAALPERARRIPPASSWRLPALREMVKIDLERQWARGHRIGLEQYLQDYPELGRPDTVDADLIHAEYEVRLQFGAPTDLDDYARRFPAQVGQLRALIASGRSSLSFRVRPPSGLTPPAARSLAARGPGAELPEQFGRYRILRRLGAGGMGSVYLAEDTRLKRKVALKVAHVSGPESRQVLDRFHREAEAAARLDHPFLCKVYDVDEIDGVHYLTMEYIEGTNLADYVAGRKDLSQRQVAAIVGKLALALQEAHAKGVVHRDLKPSNVMIKMSGQKTPVIVDFGLAQHASAGGMRLTRTGQALGTPHYMAIEQVKGDLGSIGPACDIYALGVMLYELLTGVVPFDGPNPMVVIAQILTTTAAPPSRHRPDIDPRLEAICLKAMAKQIGDRYASMAELAAALTEFLRSPAPSPTAQPAAGPAAPESPPAAAPPPRQGSDTLMAQFFENLAVEPIVELKPRSRAGAATAATPNPDTDDSSNPTRRRGLALAVGGGLVLAAILWAAGGLIVKTRNGLLVFQGLPPDAQVFVDGERVSVSSTTEEGAAEFSTRPGRHGVEVKRNGVRVYGDDLSVYTGGRTPVHVRLEPLASPNPTPAQPPAAAAARDVPVPLAPLAADDSSSTRPKYVPNDAVHFGTSWYKLYDGGVTWKEAMRRCEEMGGQLVTVDSEDENNLVHSMMLGHHLDFVLLGATDEVEAGNWVWVDGTPVRFNRWDFQQNQPNHVVDGLIENYTVMRSSGLWWDVQQTFKGAYICEWVENPPSTERKLVDATAPRRPNNVPSDAERFGKNWYKLYLGDLTWKEAKRKCEEMGGHLVILDSSGENGFVRSLLLKAHLDFAWLGATDEAVEGTWVWVDGTPMRFNRWDLGARQPNNEARGVPEHYAVMNSSGLWWDLAADRPSEGYFAGEGKTFGYICEWDQGPQSTDRNLVDGATPTRPKNVPNDAVRLGTSWYKLYDGGVSWKEAKRKCEEMGGRLVIIDSEEENNLIHSMMLGHHLDFVLLGATDEVEAGRWVWVDGTPVRFNRWDTQQNQPNSVTSNGIVEQYAAMKSNGLWWDVPDDRFTRIYDPGEHYEAGYICEWDRDRPSNGSAERGPGPTTVSPARAPEPAATPRPAADRLRDWFSVIGPGSWEIHGTEVVQTLQEPDASGERWFYVIFGDQSWSSYDLTLEVNRTGVTDAVGIMFHWLSKEHNLAFNMGAYDNRGAELRSWFDDKFGRKETNYRPLPLASRQWHPVRIEVRGEAVRCYLDGELIFADADPRFTRGSIGLACWQTAVRFRSIRVSAPDGKLLWRGPLAEPAPARNRAASKK